MSGTVATVSSSWAIPQAADIADAYCQSYLAAFPGCDPYEPNQFMTVQARTHGIVGFGLYLYQRSLADELMPDTARVWLQRHADQWGVPRLTPRPAIGPVVFVAPVTVPPLALPSGIEIVAGDGTQWITTAAATVGADGTATVPVQAELAGTSGNVAAGAELTVISPVLGLQNQAVTVGAGGLAGGLDLEAVEDWRARIELRIRKRGRAGNPDDYIQWAEDAGAAPTPNVIANWVGPGSVGVVVAMPNPNGQDRLVPTDAEAAAIAASIGAVRPVTDNVVTVKAVQLAQPLTIALDPDTVVGRARATAAAASYLATLPIGGKLRHDKLEGVIGAASGADVELLVPAADVQAAPSQMFIIGAPGFVGYA